MKRYIFIPLFALLLLILNQSVLAEPSRIFFQETAGIEATGSVALDLDYAFDSGGASAGLRVGAFDGVVLVNSNAEGGALMGFKRTHVGFKKLIQENVAAYGLLSYYKDGATTGIDFSIGVAYTVKSGTLTYNINPELITNKLGNERGGKNTLFIKGGVLIPLTAVKSGNVSAVAEVNIENNNTLDTIINLGFRWVARKDITLDFIVYNDRGDNGTSQGIPGWIKANIQF